MRSEEFFQEQTDQSEIKALIVAKYFRAWARVMLAVKHGSGNIGRIAYVDLFAGPGRYKNGACSTPLLVLETAIATPELRDVLVTVFNDKDAENVASLTTAIDALPEIASLRHRPQVYCSEISEEIEATFRRVNMCPTFSFVDPWGYKGLSRGFIQAMIKDWGCDSVFFFNYGRVNAGLDNDAVRPHMDALFGRERIERMREIISPMASHEREPFVIEELASALHDMGAKYVLPFRFKRRDGLRTSHALIFVSKHIRGHNIMKDIMATMSSRTDDGVPSFEYSPADKRCPRLFSYSQPLTNLADQLAATFAGRTLTVEAIYDEHNANTRFVLRNYKTVLRDMEEQGQIIAEPPAKVRPTRNGEKTMATTVRITFAARAPHG